MDATSPPDFLASPWSERAFLALRLLSRIAIALMAAAALFGLWSVVANWSFILV